MTDKEHQSARYWLTTKGYRPLGLGVPADVWDTDCELGLEAERPPAKVIQHPASKPAAP